jgi:hypothetical protein
LPINTWYDALDWPGLRGTMTTVGRDWHGRDRTCGKASQVDIYDAPVVQYDLPATYAQYVHFNIAVESSNDPVCRKVCAFRSVTIQFTVNNKVVQGVPDAANSGVVTTPVVTFHPW